MQTITLRTGQRCQFLDITAQIQQAIDKAALQNGAAMVFVPHTTAAVTINENADPSVAADILHSLERLLPRDDNYSHLEGNSDAHCKASLLGASLTVPVQNQRLILGTWQGIYFCEFDGPRSRQFQVLLIPAS